MCIICAKMAGVELPTEKQIRTMFRNNPHGAGYMVARNGRVEIHKGFMSVDEFLRELESANITAADSVVYHFRISTGAGTGPEMTHPFPLNKSLAAMKLLDLSCACGVAHNGIINLTPSDSVYSDTAHFITEYLAYLIRNDDDMHDDVLLDSIDRLIGASKLAIMNGDGYIATVGDFIEEDNGLLFSNSTYVDRNYFPWRKSYQFSFGDFPDDYTDDETMLQ